MYAVSQRYQFDPKASGEISRHLQEGLVRVLNEAPGFVAYYWLDTGEGVGSSLSVFEDKAGAEWSVRLTAAFVGQAGPRSGSARESRCPALAWP